MKKKEINTEEICGAVQNKCKSIWRNKKILHTFVPSKNIRYDRGMNKIKEVIAKHGFTQREVARMIGTSEKSLTQRTRTNQISTRCLIDIANAIGADLSEFEDDNEVSLKRLQTAKAIQKNLHSSGSTAEVNPVVMDAAIKQAARQLYPEDAICGGVVELNGRRYLQMYIPMGDARKMNDDKGTDGSSAGENEGKGYGEELDGDEQLIADEVEAGIYDE